MSGTLYGLGIGPGDPGLITLKAMEILARVPVIAYPAPEGGESLVRAIADPHVPAGRTEIAIATPMAIERFPAQEIYDRYAAILAGHLDDGRDVAVLCEGDPFFYGSFMYLFERLAARYPAVVVPGVSSLAAVTAAAGTPLVSRNEVLSVLPAPLPEAELEARLARAEAAAVMKVGRHAGKVRRVLDRLGLMDWATYVERASMSNQRILPLVDALPAGERGFYSLYFHGGLGVDAVVAADHLRGLGVRSVQLWSDARSAPLAAAVRAALARAGIEVHTDAPAVVSMLPVPEHLARARVDSLTPTTVWLPGNRLVARTDLDDLVRHAPHTVVVSPLRAMADASVLRRTEGWLSQRGLSVSHAEVAAAALQAATVLGDALTHIDFDFTREYVLELLEHGLENMVPYGPYPRLAIAADQREASKGSYLGRIEQGRLSWSWRPVAR